MCKEAKNSNKPDKLQLLERNKLFQNLEHSNKHFIESIGTIHRLTQQDLINLVEWTTDFEMWESDSLASIWDESGTEHLTGKIRKQKLLKRIKDHWQNLKTDLPNYDCAEKPLREKGSIVFKNNNSQDKVLGVCPVFSDKTRCCNLQTLDAVMNCGYECSYCSIQSFYHGEEIIFQGNFQEKLQGIELDPEKIYHIGTGQSSDSLMWGNKNNVLKDLFEWAQNHPNVILELKTKSANTGYLLEHEIPSNVLCTWSLNAETIVKNEELRTATLQDRIAAARRVADKGNLVGFHLHPIVAFQGWETEYPKLVNQLTTQFTPDEVALVSLGTLTFIKPVLKQLRERKQKSKILQMPFEDAAGKTSYPLEFKQKFFKTIYDAFTEWHKEVYFYMCMEDPALWAAVFGYEYANNTEFETAMKTHYMRKIKNVESRRQESHSQ